MIRALACRDSGQLSPSRRRECRRAGRRGGGADRRSEAAARMVLTDDRKWQRRAPREVTEMATVSIRYIVNDVDAAIAFYCENLGFAETMHPAPTFAMLSRGDLRLALSAPGGGPGGGQAMPDGTMPRPGGWNRFSIEVPDLAWTGCAP